MSTKFIQKANFFINKCYQKKSLGREFYAGCKLKDVKELLG